MHLQKRDITATVMVAAGWIVYLLHATGVVLHGTGGTRTTAAIILALGFVASAVAVVPGFEALLHGSRVYLAGASLLGAVALASGVIALVSASATALAILVGATTALWLMATIRHAGLLGTTAPVTTAPVANIAPSSRAAGKEQHHAA